MEESRCFWTKWSLLVSSQISISLEINTLAIWLLGFCFGEEGVERSVLLQREKQMHCGSQITAAEYVTRPMKNVQLGIISVLWAGVQEVVAMNCHP